MEEEDLKLEWDNPDDPDPETLDSEAKIKYWLSRTPQERMRETERLRRIKYGYKATERIKKVLEIVDISDWK
jgi:acyl-CoA thioesterase